MSKIYVATLIILDPENFTTINNGIKNYDSERILVRKAPFGYREVFTKHFFSKGSIIEENTYYNNDKYRFRICDSSVAENLENGEIQFILDAERSFPLREAEENDASTYLTNYENSALKKYYDEIAEQEEKASQEAIRQKASKKRAKRMIKESAYNK